MSSKGYKCPICGEVLTEPKRKFTVTLNIKDEDKTTAEIEDCSPMLCPKCYNLQLFLPLYKKNIYYELFKQ